MQLLKKFSPFYNLTLFYISVSFILRIVLLFHPITQSTFVWTDTIKIFTLGLISDFFVFTVLSGFLWLYLIFISKSPWIKIKAMAIGSFGFLVPFVSWMYWGPGQYFFNYQKDAGAQYLNYLKLNGPVVGWIEESNFINLFKKSVVILSDIFFLTNDLYRRHGKFGVILLVFFFFLVITWVTKIKEKSERNFYIFGLIQIFLPVLVFILSFRSNSFS